MDFDDDLIEAMLEEGYLEIVRYNKVGDPIYKLTEKFYKDNTELVESMKLAESDVMGSLWFKGFVDVKMSEDGEGYVYFNDKSDTWYSSDELTDDEKSMMYLLYSRR